MLLKFTPKVDDDKTIITPNTSIEIGDSVIELGVTEWTISEWTEFVSVASKGEGITLMIADETDDRVIV